MSFELRRCDRGGHVIAPTIRSKVNECRGRGCVLAWQWKNDHNLMFDLTAHEAIRPRRFGLRG
jgi:hypothetical protein